MQDSYNLGHRGGDVDIVIIGSLQMGISASADVWASILSESAMSIVIKNINNTWTSQQLYTFFFKKKAKYQYVDLS